jgi:hypothetical protein
MTKLTYIPFAININMICSIHHRSKVQSIKTVTQQISLYKEHFVRKHTYRQYGQGGALSRKRSPKNSHSYMLNITPSPM